MLGLEAVYGDNMGLVLSDKVVTGAFRCMSPTTLSELWYNGVYGSNNGLMSEICVCIVWGRFIVGESPTLFALLHGVERLRKSSEFSISFLRLIKNEDMVKENNFSAFDLSWRMYI